MILSKFFLSFLESWKQGRLLGMRNALWLAAAVTWFGSISVSATDVIFENFGALTNAPQVDAAIFANYGDFTVNTILPYEAFNTLNFTNTGRMSGIPGFDLDYLTFDGFRHPAANFFNAAGASVRAGFDIAPNFLNPPPGLPPLFTFENPQILVTATNILSPGSLRTAAGGLVRLRGTNVNVVRSAIGVEPSFGGIGFTTPTNFFPDQGIFDRYWAISADGSQQLIPNSLFSQAGKLVRAQTPVHTVTNLMAFFPTNLMLTGGMAFVWTNKLTDTNWTIQGAIIQNKDTNFNVDVRFGRSTIPTNDFKTVVVEFATFQTNVLDAGKFRTTLYIIDRLAAETNYLTLTNIATTNVVTLTTFRPANYEITRVTPSEFSGGVPSNAPPSVLFDPKVFTNVPVPYIMAAYGFQVTNLTVTFPPVPGASVTNLGGRIEINAENLNMERTRIRGEGFVSIETPNLLSSSNAAIDAPNLTFNLSTTSGDLIVQNLAQKEIDRMQGPISLWSGVFTNLSGFTVTNVDNGNTNVSQVEIKFHFLVVDASLLNSKLPVFVSDFTVHAPNNVVIKDTLRFRDHLRIEAESLTIATNQLFLLGPNLQNWNAEEFPRLRFLTNFGLIVVTNTMNLGQDRGFPYSAAVNFGTNLAFDYKIRTDLFENHGQMVAGPGFNTPNIGAKILLGANTIRLDGGLISAGGEINLSGNDLFVRNATVTNADMLVLALANSVADGGPGTSNNFASIGIQLPVKPRSGNLLFSTFVSIAPKFALVPHLWAAEDRGRTTAGFQDNAAIGRLVIKSDFDTLHSFSGVTGNNGLYVDFLEFQGAITNDVTSGMEINPGLVIYFANSNLSPEKLNGLFEGRLLWVRDFAGPASSVTVMLQSENRTVMMNRALRESLTIDSDGDGIPNGLDPYPLDPDPRVIKLSVVRGSDPTRGISFSWQAAPKTSYQVEFATRLIGPLWHPLATYTNPEESIQKATVQDQTLPQNTARYYRVRRQ